jgi:hypothetical protein
MEYSCCTTQITAVDYRMQVQDVTWKHVWFKFAENALNYSDVFP